MLPKPTSFALSALLTLLCAGAACRPAVGDLDPVNLTWDESAAQGFNKVQKLSYVQNGIRVFTWNVAWGSLNAGHDLDRNLLELIRSRAKPDLMVLTEFKEMILFDSTLKTLHLEYPHSTLVKYNEGKSDVGIAVFSLEPFTQATVENLDWTPRHLLTSSERETYRQNWRSRAPQESQWWNRPYLRLRWNIAGQLFNLIPVHLLEPWAAYKQVHGDGPTLLELAIGDDNPLQHQIDRLLEKMRRDFGDRIDAEPVLLIGDFNAPRNRLLPSSGAYHSLATPLSPIFPGPQDSFPAFSSPERQRPPFSYSSTMIDHAFGSKQIKPIAHAVLPLRGSDHYPIYVIVDPR